MPTIEGKASLGSGILNCLVRIRAVRERLGEHIEIRNEVGVRGDEQGHEGEEGTDAGNDPAGILHAK